MKKYWITALLVALAIVAIGGTVAAATATNSGPKSVNVTESGKQIELSAGDSLVVTLDSNPSTGFSWSLAGISDGAVIEKVGNEYRAPETQLIGAGGQEIWMFKALEKGSTTIELKYSRPWETGVEPAETFIVTVVVN